MTEDSKLRPHQYSWTPAEAAAGPDDTGDLVRQLLAIGGLGVGGSGPS